MATLATATPAMLLRDYLVAYLNSKDIAILTGWAISIGKMPHEPDKQICLIDQGGPAAYPNLLVDFPGIQVLVRGGRGGTEYQSSYLQVRRVRDAILGMPNQPSEFPELDGVTERGHIVPLGYDEMDRHTWSSNYQLIVEPGTNTITHRSSL